MNVVIDIRTLVKSVGELLEEERIWVLRSLMHDPHKVEDAAIFLIGHRGTWSSNDNE